MEVTAFYPDGTNSIVTEFDILPLNGKNYLYDVGTNKVSIRAKLPLSYLTEVEVNVTEFDYETALIDFDYTVNSDGTIKLNSWKQTLNGQTSSELIVPNNGLIKI
jgi:AAA15 family ATPase/GTPase